MDCRVKPGNDGGGSRIAAGAPPGCERPSEMMAVALEQKPALPGRAGRVKSRDRFIVRAQHAVVGAFLTMLSIHPGTGSSPARPRESGDPALDSRLRGNERSLPHGDWAARWPALVPAILPNTAPFIRPVPPG